MNTDRDQRTLEADKTEKKPREAEERTLSSPYGPHHGQIDEASGGADSSPLETTPSGEQSEETRTPQHRQDES